MLKDDDLIFLVSRSLRPVISEEAIKTFKLGFKSPYKMPVPFELFWNER